jgi:four helix bundle protein
VIAELSEVDTMKHAQSFKDLVVYQKARGIAKEVFKITQSFPKEEMYSLTDQVRRSSRSIGAQIAEAWGKRRYEKHFISKLTDADAEQLETQHWIEVAEDCNYVIHAQALQIISKCSEIGRMLNSMIKKAEQFCGKTTDH